MNKLPIFIILATAFASITSCGGNQENPELTKLKLKRDSLKVVYTELGASISEIEDLIIAMDTNNISNEKQVYTLTAQKETFAHYFEVQGVVETAGNANISTETPGTVSRVYVKTGDVVSKGQLLVAIDDELFEKNIAELKNALSLAEDVFSRQEKLWDQKIGSEMEYLQAKNNVEGLRLKMQTVKAQQGKSSIRAPFTGVVDQVSIKKGQLASPGFPLIRLVSMNGAYLKADVSEQHLLNVRKGQRVEIEFPSLDAKETAVVSRVGSFIDPNNRTFLVEVDLSRTNVPVKPNLLGYVWINDYNNDSSIVVPSGVVLQDATGQNFVYVAKKGKNKTTAAKVNVKVGQNYEGKTEVLEGIEVGDQVITEGARLLTDGEKISLKKQDK